MTVITTIENVRANDTFDVSDYPACKVFFPMSEASGHTVTDAVAGVTATHANWTANGTKLVSASGTNSGTMVGSLPSLGTTGMPILLAVFDVDAIAEQVGLGVTDGVHMDLVHTVGGRIDDNTNEATAAGIDNNSKAAAVYLADRAGTPTIYLLETDGTTAAEVTNNTTTVPTGELDLSAGALLLSGTGTACYGVAAFQFATDRPENDLLAAMSWCNYHWRLGHKVLPPWWKNVT